VFDCDVQDALIFLISLHGTKNDLLSFTILVSKFEWWKGRHFYGRSFASLRHCGCHNV